MEKPLVSIILPCYNHAKYLQFCVKSIQDQGVKQIEIIIINDASTDDSLKIAKLLAHKDKRIKILNNRKNIGCIKSADKGCRIANGKYINLFSSDDGMLPGNLKKKIEILEENAEIGQVFSEMRVIDMGGKKISDSNIRKKKSYIGKDDYLEFITGGSFIHTGSMLARKDALQEAGFQDINIPLAAEWNMQLQLVKKYKSAYINEPLVLFRVHDKNMSKNFDLIKCREQFDLAIKEHLKNNPSKKVEKLLYASLNYQLGRSYYNKQDYLHALKYFIKSLMYPSCLISQIYK